MNLNKLTGYLLLAPLLTILMTGSLSVFDIQMHEQAYSVLVMLMMLGFIFSIVKIWKLPNPEKMLIQIPNKVLGGLILIVVLVGMLAEGTDNGSQLSIVLDFFTGSVAILVGLRFLNTLDEVTEVKTQNINNSFFKLIGFCVAITVLLAFISTSDRKSDEDISSVSDALDDVIYGTSKSSDQETVDVMQFALSISKEENMKLFPNTFEIDTSNALEVESFLSIEELDKNIELLQGSVEEMRNAKVLSEKITKNVVDRVRNEESIPKEAREYAIEGYLKYTNNYDRNYLMSRRFEKLGERYEVTLDLYQFLKVNWDMYDIEFSEDGDFFFVFSDPTVENKFYELADIVSQAEDVFFSADKALIDYVTGHIKDYFGEDIDVERIRKDAFNSEF